MEDRGHASNEWYRLYLLPLAGLLASHLSLPHFPATFSFSVLWSYHLILILTNAALPSFPALYLPGLTSLPNHISSLWNLEVCGHEMNAQGFSVLAILWPFSVLILNPRMEVWWPVIGGAVFLPRRVFIDHSFQRSPWPQPSQSLPHNLFAFFLALTTDVPQFIHALPLAFLPPSHLLL